MDNIAQNFTISVPAIDNIRGGKDVFQVKNERMGGFVPSYDAPKNDEANNFDAPIISSYRAMPKPTEMRPIHDKSQEFGFLDLVDMVNPLQHIPVINSIYRGLSGDEIKPASKIIGGGIFGGPAGVASGLVNAVIEAETGKDMIGNVTSFAGLGYKEENAAYDFVAEQEAYDDLPAALLSFAQIPAVFVADIAPASGSGEAYDVSTQNNSYERVRIASGRTAGTIAIYS